jgi:nicotinamide mononucleotide transporter
MNESLSLLGLAFTPLELVSFVLSVLTVLLNIRQNHWAWLFAIISSATYGAVFYHSKLYGDMGLQVVFIVVSVWGWYSWLRGGAGHKALQVTRLDRAGWLVSLAGWAVGYVVLAYFLKTWTDTDVPHIDGFLTAGSLVGQVLLSRKKVENWHAWIAVDILYVGLYVYKHLALTGILYALFVAMAVVGLRAWSRDSKPGLRAWSRDVHGNLP